MRERDLFIEVLKLEDPVQRREYLSAACGDDIKLLGRVKQLLAEHERQETFILDAPPLEVGAEGMLDQPAFVGTQIGPYKLLQQIGEGGMGVVYMAEQTEPVARRVALKVIKPGMDSRQVIARFEAERQALALMDHPNIARVLDAGTVPLRIADCGLQIEEQAAENPQSAICNLQSTGRPYFVMELVRGVPITQYCDERQLTVRQRLELLIPVCQAIQHAHQKGIIHRDIKPTNVLIALYDGMPVPKVIDFGVAKATGPRLTEKTMFTQFGQLVGTLEYMSPEQAQLNQLDIDTRSDIYSLGVLLYELLTGSTPLDQTRLRTLAFDETLRIIREEEPLRPSTKLSSSQSLPTIAANRGSEPSRLQKSIRGELDWIVMKCLEKDRNRRYETANGLGLDLQRYLTDEPVQACPPSWHYRLGKLARKHRFAIMMAAVVLLITLLAVGSIGWILRDAAAQEAIRRAAIDRDVVRSLDTVEALYQQERFPAAQIALREAERSVSRGDVSQQLSDLVHHWKADLAIVAQLDEIEVELVEQSFYAVVDEQGERWDEPYRLAFAQYGLDFEKLPVAEAARRIRASSVRKELLYSLERWAIRCQYVQTPHADRLIAVVRQADPDPWHQKVLDAYLRRDFTTLAKFADNEELLRQPSTVLLLSQVTPSKPYIPNRPHPTIDMLLKVSSRKPDDFRVHLNLANHYAAGLPGAWPDAVERFRVALLARPSSAAVHRQFGTVLAKLNRGVESDSEFREAIRLRPDLRANYAAWFMALQLQKRWADAEAPARELVRRDPRDVVLHMNLGDVLFELGRIEEAEAAYEEARAMRPDIAPPRIRLAENYARSGAWEKAAAIYRRAAADDLLEGIDAYHGAVLLHFLGDTEGARKCLAALVASIKEPKWHFAAAPAAKACLLLPTGDDDPGAILRLAPRNTLLARGDLSLISGLSLYRRGHLEAAIDRLQQPRPLTAHPGHLSSRAPHDAAVFAVLTMACQRLTQKQEAESYLNDARQVMKVSKPDPGNRDRFSRYDWSEWLVCEILLREAEKLLEGATSPAATVDKPFTPAETTPPSSRD